MGVLQAVMQMQQLEQQRKRDNSQQVQNFVANLNNNRQRRFANELLLENQANQLNQQSIANQFARENQNIKLAANALERDGKGGYRRNEALEDSTSSFLKQGQVAGAMNSMREAGIPIPGQSVAGSLIQQQQQTPVTTNDLLNASQGVSDLLPTKINVAGVPTSFESRGVKTQQAIDEEVNKKAATAIASVPELNVVTDSFLSALKQVHDVQPSSLKGTVGGSLSRFALKLSKGFRQDELNELVSFQKQTPVLARKLAKASGEAKISDQDAEAFLNAIINFDDNALSVNIDLAEGKLEEIKANITAAGLDAESNGTVQTMQNMVNEMKGIQKKLLLDQVPKEFVRAGLSDQYKQAISEGFSVEEITERVKEKGLI